MSVVEDLIALLGTLAALGAVYYAYLTVGEGRAARAEAEQMHADALAAEFRREQALQLDRIAELVREICQIARAEHVTPPPLSNPPQPMRLSALPSTLSRLAVALEVYTALEGPQLPTATELAKNGWSHGTHPLAVLGRATSVLADLADFQRRQLALDA